MIKDVEILFNLQEEDLRLLDLEKKIKELPLRLKSFKEAVESGTKTGAAEKSKLKDLLVERKKIELELESKLANIQKLEGQLMQVKTNQEYKAMEKEIFNLKFTCSQIEDKILNNMEEFDTFQQSALSKEKELQAKQTELKKAEDEITGQIKEMEENRGQVLEKKQGIASTVEKKLYDKYSRILQHHKDKVVVPVVDKTCGGCHMVLPPQVLNDVFKEKNIIFCENCTRILYWPANEKTPAPTPPAQTS